jgi:hypothetical protein
MYNTKSVIDEGSDRIEARRARSEPPSLAVGRWLFLSRLDSPLFDCRIHTSALAHNFSCTDSDLPHSTTSRTRNLPSLSTYGPKQSLVGLFCFFRVPSTPAAFAVSFSFPVSFCAYPIHFSCPSFARSRSYLSMLLPSKAHVKHPLG